MKATLMLRKGHERIQNLFENFRKSVQGGSADKRSIMDEVRAEFMLHSQIEQEVFYSALKDTSTHKEAGELIDSLVEEHLRIEKLLQEIGSVDGNDKLSEQKVARVQELVQAHVAREEEELFAEARRVFTEQRLEELGLDMEHRRVLFAKAVA